MIDLPFLSYKTRDLHVDYNDVDEDVEEAARDL